MRLVEFGEIDGPSEHDSCGCARLTEYVSVGRGFLRGFWPEFGSF